MTSIASIAKVEFPVPRFLRRFRQLYCVRNQLRRLTEYGWNLSSLEMSLGKMAPISLKVPTASNPTTHRLRWSSQRAHYFPLLLEKETVIPCNDEAVFLANLPSYSMFVPSELPTVVFSHFTCGMSRIVMET